MSTIFVGPPNEQPPEGELATQIIALQAQIDSITASGKSDECRICGLKPLTWEHIPSKAAHNKDETFVYTLSNDLDPAMNLDQQWDKKKVQGGVKERTLCENCNNQSGHWFNKDYLRLVHESEKHALGANKNRIVEVSVSFNPLFAVKQVLSLFLSTTQPGMTTEFPSVSRILKGRYLTGRIPPLRMGMFLQARKGGGRSSGLSVVANTRRREARILAEFSWWPLGWVLAIDDMPIPPTCDVSGWFLENKFQNLTLQIPCLDPAGPFLGIFVK